MQRVVKSVALTRIIPRRRWVAAVIGINFFTQVAVAACTTVSPASAALDAVRAKIANQFVVELHSPLLESMLRSDSRVEVLMTGLQWAEGPVPVPNSTDVLFSDVPANRVYRYSERCGVELWLAPSGTQKPGASGNIGANGLLFTQEGDLLLAQHGDRRIAILPQGDVTQALSTVVGAYQGQQLNSPNDLVINRAGMVLFTDPPYGLALADQDPAKELNFNGVFAYNFVSKQLEVISKTLTRPNGLALSPDEQFLYVANSDPKAMQIWRFARQSNGHYNAGQLWLDFAKAGYQGPGLPDGLKVLPNGWLLATGPGGVYILNERAQLLGRIISPVAVANLAWHPQSHYLYLTASQYLLRIRLSFVRG